MRFFFVSVLLLISLFLQYTALSWFAVLGVKPDLVLIVVVFNAFLKGRREGALVGFAGGLLTDLATGSNIGIYAFSMSILGYLVGLFKSKLYEESPFIVMVMVWLASFINYLIHYMLLNYLGVKIGFDVALTSIIIPSATYTSLLVPFLYGRFYRSNQKGWLSDREI